MQPDGTTNRVRLKDTMSDINDSVLGMRRRLPSKEEVQWLAKCVIYPYLGTPLLACRRLNL